MKKINGKTHARIRMTLSRRSDMLYFKGIVIAMYLSTVRTHKFADDKYTKVWLTVNHGHVWSMGNSLTNLEAQIPGKYVNPTNKSASARDTTNQLLVLCSRGFVMTKYTTMEFPRMVTMVKSEPRATNHMPGLLDAVQFQVYIRARDIMALDKCQ